MSERDLLHALCMEWSRLSESEAVAISAADWSAVAECQARKKALQPQMSSEAQRVGGRFDDTETGLLVQKLMAQEAYNQALLNQQRKIMSERKDAMSRSSRDLRRIRSAYSSVRDPLWTSFS